MALGSLVWVVLLLCSKLKKGSTAMTLSSLVWVVLLLCSKLKKGSSNDIGFSGLGCFASVL